MFSRIRPRLSYANVVSSIALFVVLGGGAYATIDRKIQTRDIAKQAVGTGKLKPRAVGTGKLKPRAVGTGKLKDGAVDEQKLHGSMKPRWAVVNSDGTLSRGRGVVSSNQAATGIYDVIFDRDVRECAYVATVGRPDDIVGLGGSAVVNRRPNEPEGVRVTIRPVSNSLNTVQRPFHLQVEC